MLFMSLWETINDSGPKIFILPIISDLECDVIRGPREAFNMNIPFLQHN